MKIVLMLYLAVIAIGVSSKDRYKDNPQSEKGTWPLSLNCVKVNPEYPEGSCGMSGCSGSIVHYVAKEYTWSDKYQEVRESGEFLCYKQ